MPTNPARRSIQVRNAVFDAARNQPRLYPDDPTIDYVAVDVVSHLGTPVPVTVATSDRLSVVEVTVVDPASSPLAERWFADQMTCMALHAGDLVVLPRGAYGAAVREAWRR